MKRKNFLIGVCLAALTSLSAPTVSFAKTPTDQLVLGISMNNILTLDPATQSGNDVVPILCNIYDAIVELDPVDKAKINPGLAESWSFDPAGKVITFKLNKNAKFQSGKPVTSKDVLWSWRRVVKLNLSPASLWKGYGYTAANIDALTRAPDAATVELELPSQLDPKLVLYTLATSAGALIIDSETAASHAAGDDQAQGWLSSHSAGSGPFKLDDWKPNDRMILSRVPDNYRGAAKLRRVILMHMTESQALRLMLERGDIDMTAGLSVTDVEALRASPDVRIVPVQKGNVYYLAMNMKDPRFADKRVREAVRSLIDYEGVNSTVMLNYGVLHQRPVVLGLPSTLPEPGYKLDVAKAKSLLADAGYPNGFNANVEVLGDPPFIQLATALQATLAQGGITVSINVGTGNQVYGAMRDRKFDFVVGRGGGGAEPHPHASLRSLVYNPDNRDEAKLTNFQGWRTSFFSPEINTLIDQGMRETDDSAQTAIYRRAQELYDELVPAILPISQVVETTAVRKEVADLIVHPAYTTYLRAVHK